MGLHGRPSPVRAVTPLPAARWTGGPATGVSHFSPVPTGQAQPLASATMGVIEADAVTRVFRSSKGLLRRTSAEIPAVRGVSFAVQRGELFGLLGPNGAGETTTIKMLITLLLPTSGRLRVVRYDAVAEPRQGRRRVGHVFGGDRGLYERLSGLDHLRYLAEPYAGPPREPRARSGEPPGPGGPAGRA